MTFAIEFPDYPSADLPSTPSHWIDRSWHNEPCPSFQIGEADGLVVFVDYIEADKREFPEFPRFSVHGLSQDGQFLPGGCELLASDDWAAVLAFVASHERLARMREGTLTREDAETLLREEESAERPCPDMLRYLRRVLSGEALQFSDFQASGRNVGLKRLYAEGLEIERFGSGWCLTIANLQHVETLEQLERRLFDWARGEGYFQ